MKYRNRAGDAFTLVELLAAMVVLAMLMTIIFGIFNQASKAWLLAENRTENFQSARAALDLMARDLEGAMVATNTPSNTGQKITLLTFEGSQSPFSVGWANFAATPPNDAIFFATQAPDSRGNGYADLAECGYFIALATSDNIGCKKGYYYLFRHYARSTGAGWDINSNSNSWWSTTTQDKVPILENVIRLDVRYAYADPANVSNGVYGADCWTPGCGFSSTLVPDPKVQLPRAFKLQLSVLDRRYATRLAALTGGGGLSSTELGNIPYSLDSLPPKLKSTFKEGLRTFFREVYPRSSS